MSTFRPHPDVVARRIDANVVLVHLGRNEIFSLNATAGRLWELLSEGRSCADAADTLEREFDVTAEAARAEAERLIEELARAGLAEYEAAR